MSNQKPALPGIPSVALVLGILSGALLRPVPKVEPPAAATREPARSEAQGETRTDAPPSLKDVRPVLELIGEALGVSVEPNETLRAAQALKAELESVPRDRQKAVVRSLDVLLRRSMEGVATDEQLAARDLDAYLRADVDPASRLHKLSELVADKFLGDQHDTEVIERLRREAHDRRIDVQFMVATIPDYIDSNSAWRADTMTTAIQTAMATEDYLLDRFRFIDWSRIDPRSGMLTSTSEVRLHEKQPSAMVFRTIHAGNNHDVTLQVVLLVTETPTGGIHRPALRNALNLIYEWRGRQKKTLKIVGPGFSGSTLSLALELEAAKDHFSHISVVSGSATAGSNKEILQSRLSEADLEYSTTIHGAGELRKAAVRFLGQMNGAWGSGRRVAMLVESNTAYGLSVSQLIGMKKFVGMEEVDFWRPDLQIRFPIHISQLRSDVPPSAAPAISFFPPATVALNLGERTPPSDQLPAFRPQLTSPVVETQVNSILDTLRHNRISAVGIIATDERDVLFLARAIKREIPGVQLFFNYANQIYLDPEYLPYTRGAIVASSYPIFAMNQQGLRVRSAERGDSSLEVIRRERREVFQGVLGESTFNATLVQLGTHAQRYLLDYCQPADGVESEQLVSCTPPVWISVVGDDAFWPLTVSRTEVSSKNPLHKVDSAPMQLRVLPVPVPTILTAALLIAFVAVHVYTAPRYGKSATTWNSWFLARIFACPQNDDSSIRSLHWAWVFACFLLLACIASFTAAILLLQGALKIGWQSTWLAPTFGACTGLLVVYHAAVRPRLSGAGWPVAIVLAALVLVTSCFFGFIATTIWQPRTAAVFTVERILGGGIVSPASSALLLFAALYITFVAALRRMSLVGDGHVRLWRRHFATTLLFGDADDAGLTSILDMPLLRLPRLYWVAILAMIGVVAFGCGMVSTIDGVLFGVFLMAGSWLVIGRAMLQLAQAAETWRRLSVRLALVAQRELQKPLELVAKLSPWGLSLVSPSIAELLPVARLADGLRGRLLSMTDRSATKFSWDLHDADRRELDHLKRLLPKCEEKLKLRPNALAGIEPLIGVGRFQTRLVGEIERGRHMPLLASETWKDLWSLCDELMPVLQQARWSRSGSPVNEPPDVSKTAGQHADTPLRAVAAIDDGTTARRVPAPDVSGWFADCEAILSLQIVFLLRDILARITSSMFTAMVCLTLLTGAHLFYLFQGRSAFLTVDLLTVTATALVAIWILVGMERDTVLSLLRHTTPGHINFNWEFMKRIGVYGVLPLLAVMGALFPEVQEPLFGWLDPLRKLVTY